MPPPLWSKRHAPRVAAGSGRLRREEVIWTSGATEADNLAIFGVAQYYRAAVAATSSPPARNTEAVLDPCRELERRGWRVTYLAPDSGGVVDPGQIAAALRPDTVLV